MILFNLVCLFACLLGFSEGSISQGACTGRGSKKIVESWRCNRDGSAECSEETNDCDCNNSGIRIGGTAYYDKYGKFTHADGGGWDCRSNCSGRPSTYGGGQSRRTTNEWCG
eukprot:GFUD01014832.1.p1 GENE.GFUD01014832.1~~GFUD01014832.1.p1  ORF type:complete len:112 (-),score=27.91 GFUD01014832.1:126-461(-)